MEAGYDYTLLGRPARRPVWAGPALFLAVLAITLMTAGGAYYGFAAQAAADATVAVALQTETAIPAVKAAPAASNSDYREPAARPPRLQTAAIAGQQLYPAGRQAVDYWVNPMAYEPETGRLDTSFRWWAGAGSRQ